MNLLDTVDEDFFVLAHEADWSLFDSMAEALIDRTCGKWIQCIDGMDHRYWLLRVNDATIALSLENDFGIAIFVPDEHLDDQNVGELLKDAYAALSSYCDR